MCHDWTNLEFFMDSKARACQMTPNTVRVQFAFSREDGTGNFNLASIDRHLCHMIFRMPRNDSNFLSFEIAYSQVLRHNSPMCAWTVRAAITGKILEGKYASFHSPPCLQWASELI